MAPVHQTVGGRERSIDGLWTVWSCRRCGAQALLRSLEEVALALAAPSLVPSEVLSDVVDDPDEDRVDDGDA